MDPCNGSNRNRSPPTSIYGIFIVGVEAPTEIALVAVPGEPTVQILGPEFPDAVTAVTPWSTALFKATLSGKSGPFTLLPKDKFKISTLSLIACSMAATT